MPVPTPILALVVVAATACSAAATEPAPPKGPDPAADPPSAADPPPAPVDDGPVEVSLTIPVGAGVDVVVRSVEVGHRREVTVEAPDGVVDRHVIDGDDHWWWIPPFARRATDGVEWIHLDVTEVAEVGELPDLVADARARLPRPGELHAGQVVAGHEVRSVERLGPDEDHVHLAGLPEPAVVRVRRLPASRRIELPRGATDLGDLPEALAVGAG